MLHSLSNIALPPYEHTHLFTGVRSLGVRGLEVAPSRVWPSSHTIGAAEVTAYRRAAESADLKIVGLHSLFFDQPALGLFRDPETDRATLDFLAGLSGLCRDLGGRTLVFGSPPARRRGALPLATAMAVAADFFATLCRRIEGHGTVMCVEPLGPSETDFVSSAWDAIALVEKVDHPAFRLQMDAKALAACGEGDDRLFAAAAPLLMHFHASEPDLGVTGHSGTVDHRGFAQKLRAIGYAGAVSIEMVMRRPDDPMADVAASARYLLETYS